MLQFLAEFDTDRDKKIAPLDVEHDVLEPDVRVRPKPRVVGFVPDDRPPSASRPPHRRR